jgi:hypothetical protein
VAAGMSCQNASRAARHRHRTDGQSGTAAGRGYLSGLVVADDRAPPADDALNLNAPFEDTPTMADNGQNIVATPYPFYATGGNDDGDDAFKAALISHQGASIERNQDAQFSASRDLQQAVRTVEGTKDAELRALECRAALLAEIKDHERRSVERDTAVKVELMALRAEHAAQDAARTARELAKVEADGRQAKTDAVLAAILAKLTPPV